jgi:hypothetical protein
MSEYRGEQPDVESLAIERRDQEQTEQRPATASDLFLASEAAIDSLRNRLARNSRALECLTLIDSRLSRYLLEENNQQPSDYARALVGETGTEIQPKDLQEINRVIVAELNPLLADLSRAIKDYNALTQAGDPAFKLSEGPERLLQALRVGEVEQQRTISIFGFLDGWDFSPETAAHGRLIVLDPLADQNYWRDKKQVFEKCQKRKIETGEFIGLRSADAIFELEAFAREVEVGGQDDAEKIAKAARTIADFIDGRLEALSKDPAKTMAQTDFFHGDFDEIVDVLNAAEILKRSNSRLYARLLGISQSPKTSESQRSDLFGNFFHLAVARSERFTPKNVRGSKGLVGRQILLGYLDGLTDIDNRQLPFHHVNVEQMEKMQRDLKKKMRQAKKSDDPQASKEAGNQLVGSIAPLIMFSREKELHDFFAAVARQEKESNPTVQIEKLERAARRFSDSDRFYLLFKIAELKNALGIDPSETLNEARRLTRGAGRGIKETQFFESEIEFQIATGRYFEAEQELGRIFERGGLPYPDLLNSFVKAAIKDRQFSLVKRFVNRGKNSELATAKCFVWFCDVLKAEADLGFKDFRELETFARETGGVAERTIMPPYQVMIELEAKMGSLDHAWQTIESFLSSNDSVDKYVRDHAVACIIGEAIRIAPAEKPAEIFQRYQDKISTKGAFRSFLIDVALYLLDGEEFLKVAQLLRGQTLSSQQQLLLYNFRVIERLIEAGLVVEAEEIVQKIQPDVDTGGKRTKLLALIEAKKGNFEGAAERLDENSEMETFDAVIDLALAAGRLAQAKELIDRKIKDKKFISFEDYRKLALAQAAAGQIDEAKKTIRKYFPADRGKPALVAELAQVDLVAMENLPAVLSARQENEHLAEVEREARGLFGENFYGIQELQEDRKREMARYSMEGLRETFFGLSEKEFREKMNNLPNSNFSFNQRRAALESLAEKINEPEFTEFVAQPENCQAIKNGEWRLTLSQKADGEFVWNLELQVPIFFDTGSILIPLKN